MTWYGGSCLVFSSRFGRVRTIVSGSVILSVIAMLLSGASCQLASIKGKLAACPTCGGRRRGCSQRRILAHAPPRTSALDEALEHVASEIAGAAINRDAMRCARHLIDE